jgi:hypothetical protein
MSAARCAGSADQFNAREHSNDDEIDSLTLVIVAMVRDKRQSTVTISSSDARG